MCRREHPHSVGVEVWVVSHLRPHGAHLAEPSTAADALQRPLRSRFQARLSASVRRLHFADGGHMIQTLGRHHIGIPVDALERC
jgi:hypothetical protein